jgi:hypothetical protein
MSDLDPRIARVEGWRNIAGGLQAVAVAEADLVFVKFTGATLRFEMPRERGALAATLRGLESAYALGRRDVIRQVNNIFVEARGGKNG